MSIKEVVQSSDREQETERWHQTNPDLDPSPAAAPCFGTLGRWLIYLLFLILHQQNKKNCSTRPTLLGGSNKMCGTFAHSFPVHVLSTYCAEARVLLSSSKSSVNVYNVFS